MRTYGTATLKNGEWRIEAEPHVMMRLKRVLGRANSRAGKELKLRDTLDVCRDLAWFSERWPLQIEPADHLERRASLHRLRAADVAELFAGKIEPRAFDLAVPLREYQQLAAEFILRRKSGLIADQVGLGKTASAIGVLTDPSTRPALVVTLTHLPRQWEREIKRFAPTLRTHILKKGTPYPLTSAKPDQGALFDDWPDVVITNYHKLAGWSETLGGRVKTVIFDEVQELRSGLSRNRPAKWDAAKTIADAAEFRVGLSGTPIFNMGGEFFAVLECLTPDALGTFEEFHREWCVGRDDKPRIKDPAAFGTYLRDEGLMLRRTRADVGRELPPVSTVLQPVEADLNHLASVESNATALARTILAATGSGFDKMRAAEELDILIRRATGVAKAPHVAAFVRMLVESGEKVVLFGWHHEVYRLWAEQLEDLGVRFFTGRESATQKAQAVDEFKAAKAKVLVISLRAGAGLDGLQHSCSTVVFGELDWSPGVMEQCVGRVARDGQPSPVFAYVLLADCGSDPVIADMLGLKRNQLERALDPNAPVLEKLQVDPDHVRKLAAAYLEQVGGEVAA